MHETQIACLLMSPQLLVSTHAWVDLTSLDKPADGEVLQTRIDVPNTWQYGKPAHVTPHTARRLNRNRKE